MGDWNCRKTKFFFILLCPRSVHNNLNDQKIGKFKYDTENVYLIAKPKAKTKCVTIITLNDK